MQNHYVIQESCPSQEFNLMTGAKDSNKVLVDQHIPVSLKVSQ